MKTRGRARRLLCGRPLTQATFELLEFDELLAKVATRLGSGYAVSDEALKAAEECMDAERSGDWATACIRGAQASDELWRTNQTLATGGAL
jgi:hypothetical protein